MSAPFGTAYVLANSCVNCVGNITGLNVNIQDLSETAPEFRMNLYSDTQSKMLASDSARVPATAAAPLRWYSILYRPCSLFTGVCVCILVVASLTLG